MGNGEGAAARDGFTRASIRGCKILYNVVSSIFCISLELSEAYEFTAISTSQLDCL
jgi:hypothetical protein